MPVVSLYVRTATTAGRRYVPVAINRNGKPDPHPGGEYSLRYTDPSTGKRRWEPVGTDLKLALNAKSDRERLLRDAALDVEATVVPCSVITTRYSLNDEISTYLPHFADEPKTHKQYTLALNQFAESCRKAYVDEIAVQDLRAFDSFLKKLGHGDRTRSNKVANVVTFLRNREGRRNGPGITNVTIRVKFVEPAVIAYSDAELHSLFRVSSPEQKLLWSAFLETGFREQEMSVFEYIDLEGELELVQVREKPVYGFKPKDSEERSIPVSPEFIQAIRGRQRTSHSKLVFPSATGQREGHFLRQLKQLTYEGGLNCGHCVGRHNKKQVSCAEAPVCEKWILHRFRKTAATNWLRNGAPIPEIQQWLGHSDVASTMRYLAAVQLTDPKVKKIVRAASWVTRMAGNEI